MAQFHRLSGEALSLAVADAMLPDDTTTTGKSDKDALLAFVATCRADIVTVPDGGTAWESDLLPRSAADRAVRLLTGKDKDGKPLSWDAAGASLSLARYGKHVLDGTTVSFKLSDPVPVDRTPGPDGEPRKPVNRFRLTVAILPPVKPAQ